QSPAPTEVLLDALSQEGLAVRAECQGQSPIHRMAERWTDRFTRGRVPQPRHSAASLCISPHREGAAIGTEGEGRLPEAWRQALPDRLSCGRIPQPDRLGSVLVTPDRQERLAVGAVLDGQLGLEYLACGSGRDDLPLPNLVTDADEECLVPGAERNGMDRPLE